MTSILRLGFEGGLEMCAGREGTTGEVSDLGVALLVGGNKAGVEGHEEMIILASGYIFRKRDSLWFSQEDVGQETQSSLSKRYLDSLSLSSPIQVP